MKTKILRLTVLVAAGLVLVAGAAGALPATFDTAADVAPTINYQGRLTDPSGLPMHGTFPMQFEVYDDATAGMIQWDSGIVNVDVASGLFNVGLDVDARDFNGQALWLQISVDGESLSPRQALLPVPYALSLSPGAIIKGQPDPAGYVMRVEMDGTHATRSAVWGYTSTGNAVRGTSAGGYGLAGYTDDGYAVVGRDMGTNQARGYGGYFTSDNGVGVYGYSSASSVAANAYTPGVYGRSANGAGVYGQSDGGFAGVYGYSADSTGVTGRTGGNTTADYGVLGSGGDWTYGVYGYNSGTVGGLGVYGNKEGGGSAVSGYNEGTGTGTWGYSSNYNGVGGGTARSDSNYGLYTSDNIYSSNYHTTGAMMQVVQNGGSEPLEAGDVVDIAGMGASVGEGLPPVIQVRKPNEADSTALLGVVASSYAEEWLADPSADPTGASSLDKEIPSSNAGPVAPGEYLLVVVRGPVQVKVGGTSIIQPGDLLSSATLAGYAQKAPLVSAEGSPAAPPGSFLGKALEKWEGGQGRIYVYVGLQ
ncbi:MAG: hypothetical protein ACK2UC_05810 [Anaerolineae bacterium]